MVARQVSDVAIQRHTLLGRTLSKKEKSEKRRKAWIKRERETEKGERERRRRERERGRIAYSACDSERDTQDGVGTQLGLGVCEEKNIHEIIQDR